MSDRMRAVTLPSPGGPEALVLTEVDRPTPAEGEVLIEVAHAGVNRPDVLQRMGIYPVPEDASPLPGLEVSGVVVDRGAGADHPIGARVCALCNGGGYAEYVTVPSGQALPVPDGLSLAQAAAIPETFFTVWYNAFELGRLRAGEALLVHGGTSGIGTAAIQLAHAAGARVYTTAGSADKCAVAAELGAVAFDYHTEDFVAAVQRHEDGVDVVLDMVGGDYLPKNLSLLRESGRHVSIAFIRGMKAQVSLAAVMMRRLTLTGSTLRPRTSGEKAAIARALHDRVWPWLEAGTVRPVIDSIRPLSEVRAAHERMESSKHVGKLLLEVAGEA